MVDEINSQIALVVAIISAFGVIGALIFNGIQHFKDRKRHYFKIINDLEKEATSSLSRIEHDIVMYSNYNKIQLMSLSEEDLKKVTLFRWDVIRFSEKVAHLGIKKIIPNEIARYFNSYFAKALYFIDESENSEQIRKEVNFLIEWCHKENIKPHV